MKTTNCLYLHIIALVGILLGIMANAGTAYAAFPIHPVSYASITASPAGMASVIVDTTKVRDGSPFHRTAKQVRHFQTLAIIAGILAVAFFAVAAITMVPGLLIGWFVLALTSVISAQSREPQDKRKYTVGEVIAYVAFAPVIAGIALIYGGAFILFGLPGLLVKKIRERRKKKRPQA